MADDARAMKGSRSLALEGGKIFEMHWFITEHPFWAAGFATIIAYAGALIVVLLPEKPMHLPPIMPPMDTPMISVRLAKWYLSLMPVPVPAYYENRQPLERAWMEYNDEVSGDKFLNHFSVKPLGLDILDLGCGFGGRTVRYKELGAKSVTGIEVSSDMVAEAREFAKLKAVDISVAEAFGENLPFGESSFDAIFSYDVFEHVNHLPSVLKECHRVLRPGGTLYCVFPPVHHPTGGSHFHGYLSRSPIPNVLFRPKTLIEAASLFMDERGQTYRPKLRPGDYLPTVNGTTTKQFTEYLRALPFSKKEVKFPPIKSQKAWFLNPVFAVGCRVPLLREVSTHRIIASLTK